MRRRTETRRRLFGQEDPGTGQGEVRRVSGVGEQRQDRNLDSGASAFGAMESVTIHP